jgi:polar amino acid transport system substrate-binding protein
MFEDTITEALIQKSKHGALKELFSDPEAATKLGIAVKKGGSVESKIRSGVQWYLSSPQYKANATKWGFPTSSLITSTGG